MLVPKTKFGNLIVSVYHIGRTAIPRIMTKPVIEVIDIEATDLLINQMKKLGYVSWGENGIPNRRFFQKEIITEHTTFTSSKREIQKLIVIYLLETV